MMNTMKTKNEILVSPPFMRDPLIRDLVPIPKPFLGSALHSMILIGRDIQVGTHFYPMRAISTHSTTGIFVPRQSSSLCVGLEK